MTKEEKQLILKDLCARLPYLPYVLEFWKFKDEKDFREYSKPAKLGVNLLASIHQWANNDGITDRMYKPLLLPLPVMTKEQRREFYEAVRPVIVESLEEIRALDFAKAEEDRPVTQKLVAPDIVETDWLNAHHFDYRGLIEKGLAIDATNLNIYKLWNQQSNGRPAHQNVTDII